MNTTDYVAKVIMSCRTLEQLEVATDWVWRAILGENATFLNYINKVWLNSLCDSQKEYIKRLEETRNV